MNSGAVNFGDCQGFTNSQVVGGEIASSDPGIPKLVYLPNLDFVSVSSCLSPAGFVQVSQSFSFGMLECHGQDIRVSELDVGVNR